MRMEELIPSGLCGSRRYDSCRCGFLHDWFGTGFHCSCGIVASICRGIHGSCSSRFVHAWFCSGRLAQGWISRCIVQSWLRFRSSGDECMIRVVSSILFVLKLLIIRVRVKPLTAFLSRRSLMKSSTLRLISSGSFSSLE